MPNFLEYTRKLREKVDIIITNSVSRETHLLLQERFKSYFFYEKYIENTHTCGWNLRINKKLLMAAETPPHLRVIFTINLAWLSIFRDTLAFAGKIFPHHLHKFQCMKHPACAGNIFLVHTYAPKNLETPLHVQVNKDNKDYEFVFIPYRGKHSLLREIYKRNPQKKLNFWKETIYTRLFYFLYKSFCMVSLYSFRVFVASMVLFILFIWSSLSLAFIIFLR